MGKKWSEEAKRRFIPWNKGKKRGPCPWVSERMKKLIGPLNPRWNRIDWKCQGCGKIVKKTPWEASVRKYCSMECRWKYHKMPSGKNHWLYKNGMSTYKKRAFKHYGRICMICSSTNHVLAHHIDGDRTNNKIENLYVICRNCHNILTFTNKFFKLPEDQKNKIKKLFKEVLE